jgi:hypothetical protein
MKRKTGKLLDRARESLILGVEVFNRPSDTGRVEGVLLTMNHAFEMLLKALVEKVHSYGIMVFGLFMCGRFATSTTGTESP